MLTRKAITTLKTIIEDYERPLHKQLAAIIVNNKNEILSIGYALKKTHPFQKKFGKNPESIYLHAEIDAIYKALKRNSFDTLQQSSIYIARIKKYEFSKRHYKSMFGLAKPCTGCRGAIEKFGFKKVVFTKDSHFENPLWEEFSL